MMIEDKGIKGTLGMRESSQGRTKLRGDCFPRMGLDLIGEGIAVAHWMVEKFAGLPWLELVQSHQVSGNHLLGCR